MGSITRLLIANRGEIARRIAAACRELRIESVAVYSEADVESPHRLAADRSVLIGPPPAADSYLAIGRIIDAARKSGADAIHPGYGFLSENAAFAAACEDAGLIFVGPSAPVIERMGSKIEARKLAASAGVPVVPGGTPGDQTDDGIRQEALRIGLPVLVKASAGGGGKGMRTVRTEAELAGAIPAARREALAAFGDGTLYVERLIDHPRHVEIQVFGDDRGNVVHLFERECSVQRRHQKIIEESPSPVLTPAVRDRMTAAALAASREVGYRNAGTIEFLLDGTGDDARFYFLEMNTRLQVEHPVTEAVTGVDLVRAQMAVASGHGLPWRQEQLTQRGHAIECRIYAEDPANGFLPQAGPLLLYREPVRPGVRIDAGVIEGGQVSVYYDPMLAKLIASAESRDAAIARATSALRAYAILGIRTNIPFLLHLLEHPAFRAGQVDTGFLDRGDARFDPQAQDESLPAAALAVAAALGEPSAAPRDAGARDARATTDPWELLAGWRG
ncbi:MAG TPA: biotin carboxylase N-terminal domain-containing protein [Vicinamibacterales bacterium]